MLDMNKKKATLFKINIVFFLMEENFHDIKRVIHSIAACIQTLNVWFRQFDSAIFLLKLYARKQPFIYGSQRHALTSHVLAIV